MANKTTEATLPEVGMVPATVTPAMQTAARKLAIGSSLSSAQVAQLWSTLFAVGCKDARVQQQELARANQLEGTAQQVVAALAACDWMADRLGANDRSVVAAAKAKIAAIDTMARNNLLVTQLPPR